MQTKENYENRKRPNSVWRFLKANVTNLVFVCFAALMFFSTDAKSWVLKQMISTGLFNATMKSEQFDIAQGRAVRFNYADSAGVIRNTASLQGHVVFLSFWASWCPACRAEFPSIVALQTKLRDNSNVRFLIINEDSDQIKAAEYLASNAIPFSINMLAGPVPEHVYSGVLPTVVVLDKQGKIRYRHEGVANYGSDQFYRQIRNLAD